MDWAHDVSTILPPILSDGSAHFILRITAQLVGPRTKEREPFADSEPLQDMDLVTGPGRAQYASLTWADLEVLAPWLEITNKIDGPGLGH